MPNPGDWKTYKRYLGTDRHQKAPIGTEITPELHQVSLFKRFLMCYIYNGQSAGQEPRSRVHFLLQKNNGVDERLFMIARAVVSQALFSCPDLQPVREDVLYQHTCAHRKDPPMDGKENNIWIMKNSKSSSSAQ